MYGYIYKTTNLVNGKIYIGQHAKAEWDKDYIGSGKILTYAIKKYGEENFSCQLLEECDSREALNQREKFWIEHFHSTDPCVGYNIALGGNGGDIINQLPDERRKEFLDKLSTSMGTRVWITDGLSNKYIRIEDAEDYLSSGIWRRGRTSSKRAIEGHSRASTTLTGKVFFTDGIHNKRASLNDEASIRKLESQGYYRGFTVSEKKLDSIKKQNALHAEKRKNYMLEWWSEPHYCETCGKLITSYFGSGRFCSKSCASTHQHTQETKNKIRELCLSGVCGRKGFTMSEEEKRKHSQSSKEFYKNHSIVWIHRDGVQKRISVDELQLYLEDGWQRGMLKLGRTAWNKGLTVSDPRVARNRQARDATMMKKYGTLDGHKVNRMK